MADAKDKLAVFEILLEYSSVLIHLDPRRSGVVVPKKLRRQPHIILQVGRDLPTPIPDLSVTEQGIHATLSFSRKPFRCFVPWSSIYALVSVADSRGMVWEDDLPSEVSSLTVDTKSLDPSQLN